MLEVDTALSPERASVFRNSYMTACYALMQRGRLAAGEKVLIHGAAGGIGVPAIQVAKLHGAEVIATATGEAKRAICLEEGDDYAIEYQGGFHDRVMELTGGYGVDIVYDPIMFRPSRSRFAAQTLGKRPALGGVLR